MSRTFRKITSRYPRHKDAIPYNRMETRKSADFLYADALNSMRDYKRV